MDKLFRLTPLIIAIFLLAVPLSEATSYTFYVEPTGGVVDLYVNQPGISLERMYFNIPEQRTRFTVRVEEIYADEEWVYSYFLINTTGIDMEPDSALLDIGVNKSWLSENSVDLSTIALSIDDGGWKRLSMRPMYEDSDFLHYRAESPKIGSLFAITGEPVPVDIQVTSPCNENGVCEPELGEDRENCPDCIRLSPGMCVPSERYCLGDYLFECSADGSDYSLEQCDFGCAGDACLISAPGPLAGMAVALTNPVFVSVLAILLTIIIFLSLLVKRMRSELLRVEERKASNEDVKKIVKKDT
jgi:hypothetical protein